MTSVIATQVPAPVIAGPLFPSNCPPVPTLSAKDCPAAKYLSPLAAGWDSSTRIAVDRPAVELIDEIQCVVLVEGQPLHARRAARSTATRNRRRWAPR